jgi:hypothetical protein
MPRTAARKRAPQARTVHVECSTSEGYRWLKRNLDGIAVESPSGFRIVDEHRWAERLWAAGGREVK